MSIPTGIVDPAAKRIVLPRVAKRRPNNPLRPRRTSRGSSTEADEGAERASSDGRSSTAERKEAAAERNLLRMLIKIERREFVTGSSASAMKAAHILGALRRRRKIQSQAGFEKVKTAIEEWLTALGFQYTGDFRLDGASNLLLLCPRMHVHLDVYGTIAFTPTRQRLLDLSIQLAGDNQDWLNRSRADPNAPRNLTNPIYSTDSMDWQVLVLHKDDFLPEEQPLLVLKPEFRTGGLATSPDNWALSHVSVDPDFKLPTLFLGNEPLFLHPVTHLSLFAMVVNVHSKVAACKPGQLPEGDQIHLKNLKELLDELVRLIFYHPPRWTRADDVMKLIAASADKVNSRKPGDGPPDRTPRTPQAGANLQDVSHSVDSSGDTAMVMLEDSSYAGPSGESRGDIAAWAGSVPEGSEGNDSDEDDYEDDSEDEEHGTTTSEYLTLWRSVLGPSTSGSGRDKAQDARHLFFGTRGYERPPRSPLRDAASQSESKSEPDVEG